MNNKRKLIGMSCFFTLVLSLPVAQAAPAADLISAVSVNQSASGGETVQELALQGHYFEAVVKFSGSGGPGDIAEQLAAARSAWALGLVDIARQIWDDVLANQEFQGTDRTRAMLARAILEHQEGNYEQARAAAESAAQKLEPSELRAQLWLLIGESLRAQGALSLAEDYYKKAAEEGGGKAAGEAAYLLGECQFKLGLVNESRYTFAGVDTSSPYTAQALRRLAEIDLTQRNYEGVETWIEEGRETFPAEFSDGWSTYAMVSALVMLGRLDSAEVELTNFRVKHSEGDPWYILAQAALEAAYARGGRAQLAPAEIRTEGISSQEKSR